MNPRSLLPSALVVLSFLGACEGSPSDAPLQATVADSSGVRIISLGGGLRDAPTLGAELLWSHGFAEGEYQFQYALGGALLSEGVAMVADAGNDEVVAVSEQRFNVAMGSGQGPEEVLRPVAIRVADASSVWLDDDGNGRLVLLTPDKVLESVSVQGRWDLGMALRLRGIDAAGRLLMSTSAFPREFEGRWRMADLVTLNPSSLGADTVAQYRLAEAAPGRANDPFQPYGTATVTGDRWIIGWGAAAEVRVLGERGALEQVVRWAPDAQYPGEDDLERYAEFLRSDLRRANPGRSESELERIIARSIAELEVDFGQPLPLFREFIGDDAGNVWLEDYEVGTLPTANFTVLRLRDGSIRRVVFPSPVTVLDIREGLVLAAVRNALDVQAVAVFRVEPFDVQGSPGVLGPDSVFSSGRPWRSPQYSAYPASRGGGRGR